MLTTPHVLVGLSIIKLFPNGFGLAMALTSHFLIDFFLPHWNPHIYTEMKKSGRISKSSFLVILVDAGFSLIVLAILCLKAIPNYYLVIVYGAGAFLSVFPDFVEIPFYFFKSKNKYLKNYVEFCHKYQSNANFFWGNMTQLLIILAGLKQLFF